MQKQRSILQESRKASAKGVQNPPPRFAFPPDSVTPDGGAFHCGGHADWEEWEAHLSDEVLRLERCEHMFIAALEE